MNILIVDDEALARSRLRTLLSDCSDIQRCTVAEASNAAETMALLGPTGGRALRCTLASACCRRSRRTGLVR